MSLEFAFRAIAGNTLRSSISLHTLCSQCVDIWHFLPAVLRIMLIIALYSAVISFCFSLGKAIVKNCKLWKPAPDSKLMLSYFCGSGSYQCKLILCDALRLLCDKKWAWISAAGLAFRLGNCQNESKGILFIGSLLYIPLYIVGLFEMIIRVLAGSATLFIIIIAAVIILFALGLLTRLLTPVFRVIDHMQRVKQHCTHCYSEFRLPRFKCPYCGEIHDKLIPGRCGLFFSMCSCGRFIPCSVLSKRDSLTAVCPNPKCGIDLDTANAKQFFIQIIGGNKSGKTAFVTAFQHQYINNSKADDCSVSGEPRDVFNDLERMYNSGNTDPSSSSEIGIYNFIHRSKETADQSLVFYDIPDEVLLSEAYEKSPLNFGYCDGILILIDPLSVSAVRNDCISGNCSDVLEYYSKDNPESIVIHFINKFSEIVGRSARRMSDIPVAVLITKCDLKCVKRCIGISKIKSQYRKAPEQYGNKFGNARDTLCRKYLADIGLANIVNNLDSVFSEVNYFPVSAIGHAVTAGTPFEPFGVLEPVTWITASQKAAIFAQLRNVQDAVNNEEYQDNAAQRYFEERYAKAERYYATGEYEKATDAFSALGLYRDALDRANEIRSLRLKLAKKCLERQNFDAAIREFTALENYEDAKRFIDISKYRMAEHLAQNKMYPEAIWILEGLESNDTASSKLTEVKYDYALYLEECGDSIRALSVFSSLDTYKDSAQRSSQLLTGLIQQGVRSGLTFGHFTWRVLGAAKGRALLITENSVGTSPYHSVSAGISWDQSSIRNYLNNTFFNAFNKDEKAQIMQVRPAIARNDDYKTFAGEATNDRVFLLSIADARRLFADDADRMAASSNSVSTPIWWWLRSPGGGSTFAAFVQENGRINTDGNKVINPYGGLRPALFIKL